MPKKKRLPSVPLKLKGKMFVLDSQLEHRGLDKTRQHIEAEGGAVVVDLSATTSYLVLDPSRKKAGRSRPEREAAKLNAAGASIEIIDAEELVRMTRPTPDEALALLTGSQDDKERLTHIQADGDNGDPLILANADLRKVELAGLRFASVALIDVDLREADLRGTYFATWERVRVEGAKLEEVDVKTIRHCKFDELNLSGMHFHHVEHCSFRKSNFAETQNNCRIECRACDFRDANLSQCQFRFETSEKMNFRKANLSQCDLGRCALSKANFAGANLSFVDLTDANLSESNLSKANLSQSQLVGVDLRDADLSGADLSYANLSDVDLRGAKLDWADFTGSLLAGAKTDKQTPKSTKGYHDAVKPSRTGPLLKQLQLLFEKNSGWVETSVSVEDESGVQAELLVRSHDRGQMYSTEEHSRSTFRWGRNRHGFKTLGRAIDDLACKFRSHKLLWHTVEITHDDESKEAWKPPALAAWCEVFGVAVPSDEELERSQAQHREHELETQRDWIERLRTDREAVAAWNSLLENQRQGISFAGADLSGVDLSGIALHGVDCCDVNFQGATLREASLFDVKLRNANFTNAQVEKGVFYYADLDKAQFQGANLTGANLSHASLRETNLQEADLSEANLADANLRGANLSGAKSTGAKWRGARFDEKTKLPADLADTRLLKWMGKGPQPTATTKPIGPVEAMDFAEFMNRLGKITDTRRLSKATRMLKAERFQLFSDVADDSVVGIVSSQTSKGLLYACRLDSAGNYTCCTQNLNACGGLQGRPCKHLLVLLIGLAKSGTLESGKANHWLATAANALPTLDKEALAEVFLKYKGAEAGEIDWRPTETIPEDFYAL